jgi:hypothetical protein
MAHVEARVASLFRVPALLITIFVAQAQESQKEFADPSRF